MSLFTSSLFRKFSAEKNKNFVLVVHFGYGILTAMAYTTVAKKFKFKSSLLNGIGFGLTTWVASYGELTPLFKLHSTTNKMIQERKFSMTVAHVAWGIGLAMIENKLRNGRKYRALE
ncbi:DUF1440 domain-containing protein [Pseudobdellovibrio sp. HCB154]|uniref:DUF1440 domain-containing protein n=1 Tax=Pseudobdellovibrio sp. HCB154 TaxID=3386277 RepID=UPI0039174179